MGFDDSTTSSVTMNTLSPSDDDPVNLLDNVSLALSGFSSSLSIIGASIIFLTYNVEVRNARIRQTRRLLMFLTVADIMTACGILTGTIRYAVIHQQHDVITIKEHEYLCTHPDEICIAQSMITTFSGMASFCWTLVIGIHLIVSLRPSSAVSDPERPWSEIKAHVICWGLPGVITMTALGYDMLGENFSIGTGPWCWIKVCLKERKVSTMYIWMAVTGKGWDIITYVVSMVFFILLVFYLRRRGFSISDLPRRTEHRLRQADANFVFLWLLTYVLKVWGTARFFMSMTEYKTYRKDVPTFDSMEKFLLYMQSFCDGLQAFCNCILFVFLDRTMINGMINHFRCTLARRQPLLQDSQSRYGSTNC
ncbi:G-protein coupled receptor 157-like [Mizuhopecten yessoensis]|uniref:G-protein coupled receptor 157 n=1 Tax=Mizuhopecten yessoensis TaxID=6573 RepID=A0A210PXQ9_MIZYE|nr:G-protein coupled receptor 157-like [Mizuhopecten yessoensis]OWF41254.1 G-protein coupled receptor 157 [Mizuhopecten yessoensis]